MRNQLILILFAVLLSLPCNAQLTRLHNAPRGGDEIIKQRVEYKDPGRDGENVIWDFGQLLSVDPEYTLTYYDIPPFNDSTYLVLRDSIPVTEIMYGDLMAGVEHYTAYYYRVIEDTLFTIGFENPVVLMKHKPPLLTIPFPFGYGQEAECEYHSNGFYSSREPVDTEGHIFLLADAHGKMVLPSGDTLGHVLRVKSLQTIENADTTLTEEQPRLKMETETYRWYAKGYRYPVFETIRTFDISDTAKTEIFATAFFYPPLEHYYLVQDSANLAVLDSLWSITLTEPNGYDGGDEGNPEPPHNLNLRYNYYPNPVRDILKVEYYFEADATVTIMLFDINGIPLYNISKGELRKGIYIDEIDFTSLSAGSYVLRLNVGGEIVSGIVMKK
jgi:hypothetical protein